MLLLLPYCFKGTNVQKWATCTQKQYRWVDDSKGYRENISVWFWGWAAVHQIHTERAKLFPSYIHTLALSQLQPVSINCCPCLHICDVSCNVNWVGPTHLYPLSYSTQSLVVGQLCPLGSCVLSSTSASSCFVISQTQQRYDRPHSLRSIRQVRGNLININLPAACVAQYSVGSKIAECMLSQFSITVGSFVFGETKKKAVV